MLAEMIMDPMGLVKRISDLEYKVQKLEAVVDELSKKDRKLDLTKSEILDF